MDVHKCMSTHSSVVCVWTLLGLVRTVKTDATLNSLNLHKFKDFKHLENAKISIQPFLGGGSILCITFKMGCEILQPFASF